MLGRVANWRPIVRQRNLLVRLSQAEIVVVAR